MGANATCVDSAPVIFTPDVMEVVEEAGRQLREREPIEDFRLIGPVQKLDRSSEEKRGVVQVLGSVDGKPRKVAFEVSGDTWELAHQALDTRAFLSCKGELLKAEKTFFLSNPRSIAIFTGDDS